MCATASNTGDMPFSSSDCLNASLRCVVNHSISLVMTNNMKGHCYLLFDTCVDVILKQPITLNVFTSWLKRASSHLKHVHNLYIILVVDAVRIIILYLPCLYVEAYVTARIVSLTSLPI
jgi:hypothetical protein